MLLSDFDQLVLLYKPKRRLTNGKCCYSSGTRELICEINNNPRAMVLDYDVNPWIPIALADLLISMPFESPSIAGIHYGKPAFFHDPTGIACKHRYQELSAYITHDYSQLKLLVDEFLNRKRRSTTDPEMTKANLADFTGPRPETNSSDRFRDFLVSLVE